MILNSLNIQIQGIFKSWTEAIPAIKKEVPDFMIVDLYLANNQNSFEYLTQIEKYYIPTIVCTAFPKNESVNKALEFGIKAFITKPIDKANLTFQIKKIIKEINQDEKKNFITIKEKSNFIKVPYNQIYKIEIERNYSSIFLDGNKKYVIKFSLKKMMDILSDKKFIRCHRSTIVNLDFISSIDILNNLLKLRNNESVGLGNKYKTTVKEAFLKNKS